MADGGYRGVSLEQDSVRFSNKDKVLLKKLAHTFPPHYETKVNIKKVNVPVLRPWIADKTTQLLGFEDDVVVEYAIGLLEDPSNELPDPRKLQISLTGFLESKTPEFMSELWKLLISAQESIGGIPKEFVEAKKKEMQEQREKEAAMLQRSVPNAHREQQESSRGGPSGRGRSFRDKSGNVTERSRDSGWGAKRRPYDDGGYDRSYARPRYDDEDRRHGRQRYDDDDRRSPRPRYNRERSPPPDIRPRGDYSSSRRYSPSPPPYRHRSSRDTPPYDAYDRPRRSRSRSYTPPARSRYEDDEPRRLPRKQRPREDSTPPPPTRGSRSRSTTPIMERPRKGQARDATPEPPRHREGAAKSRWM